MVQALVELIRVGDAVNRRGWARQRVGHQAGHHQVLLVDFRRTSSGRVDDPILLLAFLRPLPWFTRQRLGGEAGGVRRPESIPRLVFG